jgi:hypothetical protein
VVQGDEGFFCVEKRNDSLGAGERVGRQRRNVSRRERMDRQVGMNRMGRTKPKEGVRNFVSLLTSNDPLWHGFGQLRLLSRGTVVTLCNTVSRSRFGFRGRK